ncbi:MAG: SufE family protein [Chthoniobacter sp.]|uniref:SufE family protein n=1 Tax=Chthoniobacter sp. TaxID=2510640 RepID=UPI0032A5438B
MPPLAEKQQQLIARLQLIEDSHERLAAIVARGKKWPGVSEDQRIDAHRVPGCTSRVWLVGRVEEGRCHFQMDADSPLVKGLVALLCEVYAGATPTEVASIEPEIFSALGLDRQISPTRLNGLASVRTLIRAFAESHLP